MSHPNNERRNGKLCVLDVTSIIEIVRAEGMAKRGDEWFPLSQTVVAYDQARHAPLGDVITLDFMGFIVLAPTRSGNHAQAARGRAASFRASTRTSTPVRGRGSS
jgi:hypothetical protein